MKLETKLTQKTTYNNINNNSESYTDEQFNSNVKMEGAKKYTSTEEASIEISLKSRII